MKERGIKFSWWLAWATLLGLAPALAIAEPMCPDFAHRALARQLATNPDPALRAEADHVELQKAGESKLSGNVHVRQLDRLLEANQIFYDNLTGIALSPGSTYFQNPQIGVHGDHALIDLNNDRGKIEHAHFTLPEPQARGTAKHAVLKNKKETVLNHATYTTCPPGDKFWQLSGSWVDLDQAHDVGTAYNAVLRMGGVPVLYSPYLTFPLTDQRKSGFLAPTLGTSSDSGFDLRVPYYFNLAPNYDDTLAGRFLARRGFMVDNQFRYLTPSSTGTVEGAYLPDDSLTGSDRWLVDYRHAQLLSPRWGLYANYERVSDDEYFNDLSTGLQQSSVSEVPQSLDLAYQAPRWFSFDALASGYQTLVPGLPGDLKPYTRLPQIRLDAQTPNPWHSFSLQLSSEFTNFTRDAGVEGTRLDLMPGIEYLHDIGGFHFQSDLRYRETDYQLRRTGPGHDNNPSRSLPIFSVRTGLRFDRDIGDSWVQTLEPELFYDYIPYRDQSDIPIFDSGVPDFNFIELFQENRFTGADRVGDANQLTTALTTRLLDSSTGAQKLRASIGQIYRFTTPRIQLAQNGQSYIYNGQVFGATGAETRNVDTHHSDVVGELEYQISRHWSTSFDTEWDPYDNAFNRNSVELRYRGADSRAFNIGYRYDRDFLEQTDIAAIWPIARQWRIFGRWDYSLRFKNTFDAFAGIEYESCCYIIRAAYRRYVTSDRTPGVDTKSGIFLQLQLKGFTGFGQDIMSLVKSDILGR